MNIHKQNNEMDCCLIPCRKIHKIDERHKCKNQNYKQQRNSDFVILDQAETFLDLTPKYQQQQKNRLDQKLKCDSKDNIKKMQRQPMKWEKIF